MTGPGDDEEARRRARRAAARRLHPDVGGDRDAFEAAMRATEPRPPAAVEPLVVITTRRARARRAVVLAATRVTRQARSRLPASWPGSRRYGRL